MLALGYKEVYLLGIPTGEYHTFVVATDLTTGEQIFTRGGPSGSGDSGFGFGSINGQGGTAWNEGSIDPPSQTVVMQPLGTVQMTLDQVSTAMTNYQNTINSSDQSYFPTGPNSNSYAFSFPQSIGLPRPQPLQGFPTPGANINIGTPTPVYGY